jgi:nitroreductase
VLVLIKKIIKKVFRIERARNKQWFCFDERQFWKQSCSLSKDKKTRDEAWIVIQYHIIEKGLTMPNRRLAFGKPVVLNLIAVINAYYKEWQSFSQQVYHAIGVIKAYYTLHETEGYDFGDDVPFWNSIREFVGQYSNVQNSVQKKATYEEFYANCDSSFPLFAQSRHTLRHYSDAIIPKNKIVESVRLAMTAPSACNRQGVRVHCIANRDLARRILEVQGGNRGFGDKADKILIVTSDLSVEMGGRERNAPYVNGGIFLMNLCYALHYNKIAHCILSCSIELERLAKIRKMASISEKEVIVAMLSCGIAPESFDIASSPRKEVEDILSYKE